MSNNDVGYWGGSLFYTPTWNPSGFSVTMGQTDANGVDWLWMSITGWDSPGVVGQVTQRASDHGGWATEQYFTPRTMTLTVHASAPTQALRDAARAALQQVIPVNDLCMLTYVEPIAKQIQVRRSGQILETYPDLTDVEFQCVLIAPDPRKYNATLKAQTTFLASNAGIGFTPAFTMPVTPPAQQPAGSIACTNMGSFETRPIVSVFGPMVSPSIIYDNGKTISYTGLVLHTGDTLVIDTDARYGTVNGSYRNADINSWWWVLQPGTHTIELGGQYTSGAPYMSVSFRDAWILWNGQEMASSVNLGYCMWLDGSTISSQIARVQDVSSSFAGGGTTTSLATQAGVLPSVGSLQVTTGSGMNITVYSGFAIIPNSTSNLQGAYKAGSMVSNSITVATSDPTNPRIDLVVIYVSDVGTSSSFASIEMVTGTPAASPVAPTAPANSLILAQISVPATTTSITSGLITDKRTFTSASGGIVPYTSTASTVGGYLGNLAYDGANDRYFHNYSTTGTRQMRTLPWAPQYAVVNSSYTLTTSSHTYVLCSANFTVDGNTDVKTTIKWPGCYTASTGTGYWQLAASITIDATQLDSQYFIVPAALGTTIGSGGMLIYSTSSATGDTPGAGTHTMYFQMISTNVGGVATGGPVSVRATSSQLIYIRVEPVNL